MRVGFANENTLGHGSYLPPLARALGADPGAGVEPVPVDATPLPPDLRQFGETSIKGLRRWNLDGWPTRWRLAASRHVRRQLEAAHAADPLAAVVVNTQSVGLDLPRWPGCPPVYVALDATFAELVRTGWLGGGRVGRWLCPLTQAYLLRRERELFRAARGFLPWCERVAKALRDEYRVPADRIHVLPPSVVPPDPDRDRPANGRREILFLGGNFARKGGPVLLEAFRRHLRSEFDLHVITQSDVAEEPGVHVHKGVASHSPAWRERWRAADVFVFPSSLETFGIVLLEALSFRVPVVSSRAGAAAEVLDDGAAGVLLDAVTPDAIAAAVRGVFADQDKTRARVDRGVARVIERYALAANARRLADLIRDPR